MDSRNDGADGSGLRIADLEALKGLIRKIDEFGGTPEQRAGRYQALAQNHSRLTQLIISALCEKNNDSDKVFALVQLCDAVRIPWDVTYLRKELGGFKGVLDTITNFLGCFDTYATQPIAQLRLLLLLGDSLPGVFNQDLGENEALWINWMVGYLFNGVLAAAIDDVNSEFGQFSNHKLSLPEILTHLDVCRILQKYCQFYSVESYPDYLIQAMASLNDSQAFRRYMCDALVHSAEPGTLETQSPEWSAVKNLWLKIDNFSDRMDTEEVDDYGEPIFSSKLLDGITTALARRIAAKSPAQAAASSAAMFAPAPETTGDGAAVRLAGSY